MPILIVALIALTVFGVIGILLVAAVILETRMKRAQEQPGLHPPLAHVGKH
ncbi:MAG: hypothetical protein LAO03_03600 [Acidobacteriia bacterium]|nr:hypothetical protein [Terriglobia bacterium]